MYRVIAVPETRARPATWELPLYSKPSDQSMASGFLHAVTIMVTLFPLAILDSSWDLGMRYKVGSRGYTYQDAYPRTVPVTRTGWCPQDILMVWVPAIWRLSERERWPYVPQGPRSKAEKETKGMRGDKRKVRQEKRPRTEKQRKDVGRGVRPATVWLGKAIPGDSTP